MIRNGPLGLSQRPEGEGAPSKQHQVVLAETIQREWERYWDEGADPQERCKYVAYPGWPNQYRCVFPHHPKDYEHSVAYVGKADPPRLRTS